MFPKRARSRSRSRPIQSFEGRLVETFTPLPPKNSQQRLKAFKQVMNAYDSNRAAGRPGERPPPNESGSLNVQARRQQSPSSPPPQKQKQQTQQRGRLPNPWRTYNSSSVSHQPPPQQQKQNQQTSPRTPEREAPKEVVVENASTNNKNVVVCDPRRSATRPVGRPKGSRSLTLQKQHSTPPPQQQQQQQRQQQSPLRQKLSHQLQQQKQQQHFQRQRVKLEDPRRGANSQQSVRTATGPESSNHCHRERGIKRVAEIEEEEAEAQEEPRSPPFPAPNLSTPPPPLLLHRSPTRAAANINISPPAAAPQNVAVARFEKVARSIMHQTELIEKSQKHHQDELPARLLLIANIQKQLENFAAAVRNMLNSFIPPPPPPSAGQRQMN